METQQSLEAPQSFASPWLLYPLNPAEFVARLFHLLEMNT